MVEHTMKYTVALKHTDEGFSVWVPGLPGCWSQGETEAEAIKNIRDAIKDYLEVARSQAADNEQTREVEVTVKLGRLRH